MSVFQKDERKTHKTTLYATYYLKRKPGDPTLKKMPVTPIFDLVWSSNLIDLPKGCEYSPFCPLYVNSLVAVIENLRYGL